MHDEFHISGLVVQALPAKAQVVQDVIARLPGAEINTVTVEGRIIVTLETTSEAEFPMRFAEIEHLPGVVSVMLVFHQVEPAGSG
jgi:periplasmic nitrate reductase NapD